MSEPIVPRKLRPLPILVMLSILVICPCFCLGRGGSHGGSGRSSGGGGGGFRGGGSTGGHATGGHATGGHTSGGSASGLRGGGFHGGMRGDYRGPHGPMVGHRGHGWGYPYGGYGMGLGLGLGLGYGLSSGYGYGYPGYASGYPASVYDNTTYVTVVENSHPPATQPTTLVTPISATVVDEAAAARSRDFANQGVAAFQKGDYDGAASGLRHAIVEDPGNPILLMELGMALFAMGKYEEATGAIQTGMHQLPPDHWGMVVTHYADLYANPQDYTRHLHGLEQGVKAKPNDPSVRFLLGYHYGYLGFFKQSMEQLDKTIRIEPRDEMAKQLLNEIKNRRSRPDSSYPAPQPAKETSWTKSR